jgi:hypothetical protein
MCWIAGTVYLLPSPGGKPLRDISHDEAWVVKEHNEYSQLFQCGFNIWELEKDGLVRDMLVVEHQTNFPNNWRKAFVFRAC